MKKDPKIALVYDRVNKMGGAERVLQELHAIWPEAPLYTSVYNAPTASWANSFIIIPSFLQKIWFARKRHEYLAWAMPSAFESFDFSDFDIVISVTSAEAKGIITKPETLHICYMLTPTRYLWSHTHFYKRFGFIRKIPFATSILSRMRRWDFIAASRPDKIITISNHVSKRVEKYYRRQVDALIYPPATRKKKRSESEYDGPLDEFYLVVSRLVAYKRVDLAIDACTKLGKKLVVIGEGRESDKLKMSAGQDVLFLGKVSEEKLSQYYHHCSAVLFPSEEDFGIVCVEAQSYGKPVVAFQGGGAKEIIQNHTTGVFFEKQQVESVITAIETLSTLSIKESDCMHNAARFSNMKFKELFTEYVEDAWQKHQKMNT